MASPKTPMPKMPEATPCLMDGCKDMKPPVRGRGALPKTQQHEPMPGRTRHGARGFKG